MAKKPKKKKSDDTVNELVQEAASAAVEGLKSFVGEPNTEATVDAIKANMVSVVNNFIASHGLNLTAPEVVVEAHLNQATVYIIDPKDNQKIDLHTWISRVYGGFYDRE